MIFLKKMFWALILLAVIVMAFSFFRTSSVGASDRVPGLAQSFSQYFSPSILRATDKMMKDRFNCQPDGYWKIWTDGFHRKYKRAEGKIEIILNWDGIYHIKIKGTEPEITGDWTLLK
jgi:hypothetical protein